MKLHPLLIAGALALVPSLALAATASGVVVPWGDWASSLLASIAAIAVTAASAIAAKFAPAFIKTFLTNDVIATAVNYAFGSVEGVVAGKTLTLPEANAVITAAETYVVSSAPTVAKWLDSNIRPAIIAELSALGALPSEAVK